ncbi:MAG: winged helix-turn-helix domain-containing protein [Clostridia bacterium]|nr:winged helix-turn-helix domain-containing protein [Clostridia bacterium]
MIITAIKANPKSTRAEIASQIGVSPSTIARKLKEISYIRFVGAARKGTGKSITNAAIKQERYHLIIAQQKRREIRHDTGRESQTADQCPS